MDGVLIIDGEQTAYFGVVDLLNPTKGETHFRHLFIRNPFFGDGVDLISNGQRSFRVGYPLGVDAFLSRLVQGCADVLELLASKGKGRQIQEGFLGYLHGAPSELRSGVFGAFGYGVKASGPALLGRVVGELIDRCSKFLGWTHRGAKGQSNAREDPVGDEAVPGVGKPVAVAVPLGHPRQRGALGGLEDSPGTDHISALEVVSWA